MHLGHDLVVTLNEHLMEALRRLRRNAADTSVDRRLITNVLLQFITTPRADPKRFEMLGLMASILQWSDQERELAGLQRVVTVGGGARGKRRVAEEKFEESEVCRHPSSVSLRERKLTSAVVLLPNVGRISPQRGFTRQHSIFGRSAFSRWYLTYNCSAVPTFRLFRLQHRRRYAYGKSVQASLVGIR